MERLVTLVDDIDVIASRRSGSAATLEAAEVAAHRLRTLHGTGELGAAVRPLLDRRPAGGGPHTRWRVLGTDGRVALWLHALEPAPDLVGADGAGVVVHNHRATFASVLLRGGYRSTRYDVTTSSGERKDGVPVTTLHVTEQREHHAGEATTLTGDRFHAVHDVEPGTVSVVLALPPAAPTSWALTPDRAALRAHDSF
jgi:hypothetical protein